MRRVSAMVLAASLAGCAHAAGDLAKQAAVEGTPAAVHSALQSMNAPENKQLAGELFGIPNLRNKDLQPIFRQIGADIIGGGLQKALSPATERDVDLFVTRLMSDSSTAFAQGLRNGLQPGVSQGLQSQDFDNALSAASRNFAKGIVLGVDDAFRQLDTERAQGEPVGLLGRVSSATTKGLQLSTGFAAVLGLLVLAMLGWIAWLVVRLRRDRVEENRMETAVGIMANALQASESKPWSPELHGLLEEQLKNNPAAPYFRRILQQQGSRLTH